MPNLLVTRHHKINTHARITGLSTMVLVGAYTLTGACSIHRFDWCSGQVLLTTRQIGYVLLDGTTFFAFGLMVSPGNTRMAASRTNRAKVSSESSLVSAPSVLTAPCGSPVA